MALVIVCLQYALIGLVALAMTLVIIVVPDARSQLAAVQMGSLAWTAGFAIAAAVLFWLYLRNPSRRLFALRWPTLVAEAVWLLLAVLIVIGAIV